MSTGGGTTREVTLVVRVQGPQGVSGMGGVTPGGPAIGGGAPMASIGGGGGGGTVAGPASRGRAAGSTIGMMQPAYGSSPEAGGTARGYGIPGGYRGGTQFIPYSNPFGSRTSRAPYQAPERTPAFSDISYVGYSPADPRLVSGGGGFRGRRQGALTETPEPTSPAFYSVSHVRGGGGGFSGFRARAGFQGAIREAANDMAKLKKATDQWANSLGHASLEMVRLVTWNRQITVGTWAMAEAQRKWGIPLVTGAGYAAVGLGAAAVGAGAIWGALGGEARQFYGGTAVGRGQAKDLAIRAITLGFANPQNEARARQQAQQQTVQRQLRIRGIETQAMQRAFELESINQGRISSFEVARVLATTGTGAETYAQGLARLDERLGTVRRREAAARAGMEFQVRAGAMSTQLRRPPIGYRQQLRRPSLGVGAIGMDPGAQTRQYEFALNQADRERQADELVARMNARIFEQRGVVQATLAEQVTLQQGRIQLLTQQRGAQVQNQQQQITMMTDAVATAQKRLSQIQNVETNAIFGAAGFAPTELRAATRRINELRAGRGALPRGEELSGALGFGLRNLAPSVQEIIQSRFARSPDIAAFREALGFGRDIPQQQEYVQKLEEALTDMKERVPKSLKDFTDIFIAAIDELGRLVREQAKMDAENKDRANNIQDMRNALQPGEG